MYITYLTIYWRGGGGKGVLKDAWLDVPRSLRYEINDNEMKLLKNELSILEFIYMY